MKGENAMYWEVLLTDEERNTIYTALLLERERNWGKDENVVKLLQDAINVIQSAEKDNSSRRV